MGFFERKKILISKTVETVEIETNKSKMVQLAFRPIEIRVKLPNEGEQTHLVSISSDSNLTDFRKIIAERFNIPVESQRLISSGTEIKIEKDFTLLKQQPTPNIHVISRETIPNTGITDSSEESEVTKNINFAGRSSKMLMNASKPTITEPPQT